MTTLRIEHAISDYKVWLTAFDSFAEARAKAGVSSVAIRQPVDDQKYLMLDLEFDSARHRRSPRSWNSTSGPRQRHRQAWSASRKPGSSTWCIATTASRRHLGG